MNILLIGVGNMGSNLLHSMKISENIKSITAIQPSLKACANYSHIAHISFLRSIKDIKEPLSPDVIILAIKPQILKSVIKEMIDNDNIIIDKTTIISIAAGVPIEHLSSFCGSNNIVRIMPNIGLSTQSSVNLACVSDKIKNFDHVYERVKVAFENSGKLYLLENENLLDRLTPHTGSSPALFYLMANNLVNLVKSEGISENQAFDMIKQTLLATVNYMEMSNMTSFTEMIQTVASKKGVTQRGLESSSKYFEQAINVAIENMHARIDEFKNSG